MITKTTTAKSETSETQGREKSATGWQERLDRELEDTFPASDPPSMTQPGVKPGARLPAGNDTKPGLIDFHVMPGSGLKTRRWALPTERRS